MMSSKLDSSRVKEIFGKIKSKEVTRIEPVFQPKLGLVFKWFENYPYEELKQILDMLEQEGVLTREPFSSTLKCRFCSSYRLTTRFICTICRSSNVTRGRVIEHLVCGNIDLDEKYITTDGSLVCKKCRKRVNAIGVDYSRPGFFYKCADCHATLPNAENQYVCVECGNPSLMDDLQVQQLFAYIVIDREKLSIVLKETDFLFDCVVETLNKIGIRSVSLGEVIGLSKIRHTFELVVYDDESEPILVVDTLREDADETKIMAFHAKCDDSSRLTKKVLARIIIALPRLKKEVNNLVGSLGIIVIQSETKEQAISQLVQIILRTYTEDRKSKMSRH